MERVLRHEFKLQLSGQMTRPSNRVMTGIEMSGLVGCVAECFLAVLCSQLQPQVEVHLGEFLVIIYDTFCGIVPYGHEIATYMLGVWFTMRQNH